MCFRCLYVQAKCNNIRLEPMHSGACTESDKHPRMNSTTDSPEPEQTVENFTLTQAFCNDTRPCPADLNPVCGSNRIFYVNL